MKSTTGVIYILTNPSFPQYIKIGYAKDVQKRLDTLNSSTAIPFAFRIYATYEVESELSDKKLHAILDKLNPDLRTKETVNGKNRIREFYAMPPEDAYDILEAIAEINGTKQRLKLHKATAEEQEDEVLAKEIEIKHQERMVAFSFKLCGIQPGEKVEFSHPTKKLDDSFATVVDEKRVEYKGETWTLSALAKDILKTSYPCQGPKYFKYKGEWLHKIHRKCIEAQKD